MNVDQIETERIAGEISLILENGSVIEKASMLRIIKQLRTLEEYIEIRDSYNLTNEGTSK